MQPCRLWLGTFDCVLPAKESQKSTKSYYFKYKYTDALGKHTTFRIDGFGG